MTKRLSAKDIKKYHESMFEIDYILGTTKIEFHPLLEGEADSLYNEKKRAKYGEPMYFTGIVENTSEPSSFEDSNINSMSMKVTIPQLAFSRYVFLEGDKDKEHPRIDPYSLVKGYFVIDGLRYEIQDCFPVGIFADDYTSYSYTCGGVNII